MNMKKMIQKGKQHEYPALSRQKCIAKSTKDGSPGITVYQHSLNAANVAKELSRLFTTKFIKKWGISLAALHDVGKISPGFQKKHFNNYLREELPELAEVQFSNFCGNHAEISEAAIREFLNEFLDDSASGEVAGAHHGTRKNPQTHQAGIYGGKNWAEERLQFISDLTKEFGTPPKKDQINAIQKYILAGFITISDWLASDEMFFPADGFAKKDDIGKIANKAVESCGFRKLQIKPSLSFKKIFGFPPRSSQISLIESVNTPGIYILEAETGSGKTEAALYAAYRMISEGYNNGIYFALPTKLTSDMIHRRVQNFVDQICNQPTPVMLAHGSAWLNEEVMKIIQAGGEELSAGGSWFTPRKRTLLAPIGVGTVDQALMAVMNVKHFFVRAFGLAGKVVILDEVHSYDIYTGTILDKLVDALSQMGCTVIILSATLTADRKKTFFKHDLPKDNSYPLITSSNNDNISVLQGESFSEKKIGIYFDYSSSLVDIADIAIKKAKHGECVLWVNNTVSAAQNAFRMVESLKPEKAFDVGLLHSRFTVKHRKKLEDDWMGKLGNEDGKCKVKRPNGCVLIATQVVEQSVDIDADFIITELAPMDMLIQRFGRLWRHERVLRPSEKPDVLILTGDLKETGSKESLIEALGKNNSMIYSPFILWKTWNILKDKKNISIPAELRTILENIYSENEKEPESVKKLFDEMMARRKKLQLMAGGVMAGVMMPTGDDDEYRAGTRYCELPYIDCLLVKKIDSIGNKARITLLDEEVLPVNADEKNRYITRQLHKNIVAVARYNFGRADLKVPLYLRKHFFGQLAVLEVGCDGNLFLNGISTRLFYSENLGIYREKDFMAGNKNMIDYNNYKTGEWDYESCDW